VGALVFVERIEVGRLYQTWMFSRDETYRSFQVTLRDGALPRERRLASFSRNRQTFFQSNSSREMHKLYIHVHMYVCAIVYNRDKINLYKKQFVYGRYEIDQI